MLVSVAFSIIHTVITKLNLDGCREAYVGSDTIICSLTGLLDHCPVWAHRPRARSRSCVCESTALPVYTLYILYGPRRPKICRSRHRPSGCGQWKDASVVDVAFRQRSGVFASHRFHHARCSPLGMHQVSVSTVDRHVQVDVMPGARHMCGAESRCPNFQARVLCTNRTNAAK